MVMSSHDLITINVGGQRFTTTAFTLRKHQDSRLARILDGKDPEHKLVNGQIFIDKDWTLFKFILEYLRAGQISLPAEFSDHDGLAREAEFYGLHVLVHGLSITPRSKIELLEIRFSVQESHGTFRVFCSSNRTLETLASRISVFVEHPNLRGNLPPQTQNSDTPVPVQRPSHHDLVFHCGTDHFARDDFSARFVTIKPDERKLLNSSNVLGLLVDTLLKEGFHLVSTRTISQDEKVECFTFERRQNTHIVLSNENHSRDDDLRSEAMMAQSKKTNRKK
ncbi:putative potassium channel regulatory protein [Osmerus mordax]|uniref:putative potassium channel regulatory protein n=1 Tax=Osmerus mordax TaxID=8014 RepID=UPI00350EC044